MPSANATAASHTTATRQPPGGASDLWGFLAFSHGWTWLFWGIVVLLGVDVWSSSLAMTLFALGGLGLPLGGVLMTWRVAGRPGLRDLGRRLVEPGRLSVGWWAVVLLLQPAVKLAAGGMALATGATDAPFRLQETAGLVAQPGDLLLYLGFVLLLGPLPEELGWRGYLLDRLQVRFSALGASVLVGLAWFAWHGPLFYMSGYYARAGGAPDPLQFGVMILLGAVLYTWIYNNTGRSVLGAILFHFSGNGSGELLNAPASVYTYETYLTAALVLVVLWGWGAGTLCDRVDEPEGVSPRAP
jgi:membrane protease YdiL (CAAX protease family)